MFKNEIKLMMTQWVKIEKIVDTLFRSKLCKYVYIYENHITVYNLQLSKNYTRDGNRKNGIYERLYTI
jgi:hypothetical protein